MENQNQFCVPLGAIEHGAPGTYQVGLVVEKLPDGRYEFRGTEAERLAEVRTEVVPGPVREVSLWDLPGGSAWVAIAIVVLLIVKTVMNDEQIELPEHERQLHEADK